MNAAIIPTFTPPWKTPDLIMLRSWYGCIATKQLASNLRRSVEEVEAKAVQLGLMRKTEKRRGLHIIEPDERPAAAVKKSLTAAPKASKPAKHRKQVFEVKPMREVTGILQPRTKSKSKHTTAAPHRCKTYTPDEIETMRQLFPVQSNAFIAKAMGRTLDSIKTKARELGLYKSHQRVNGYTLAEIETLRQLFPVQCNAEVAKAMGRSLGSIKTKARDLELRKQSGYIQNRPGRAYGTMRTSLIRALRTAHSHLKRGNHLAALDCLDEVLAAVDEAGGR